MPDVGPVNRELQLAMLRTMAAAYPNLIYALTEGEELDDEGVANLVYLQEHALCEAKVTFLMDGDWVFAGAKITAKGLDFLTNDGGLGAILNVVTVKLHADTIRDLIEARIDASPATPEEKAKVKSHLKRLSGAALQAIARDLMKRGLDHLPDAIQWFHTFGSHV